MLLLDVNIQDEIPYKAPILLVENSNTQSETNASAHLYATIGTCAVVSTHINNQPDKVHPFEGFDKNYLSQYGFYNFGTTAQLASYAFEYNNEPFAMHNDYQAWANIVENAEIKILVPPKHGQLMLQGNNSKYDIIVPAVGQYSTKSSYGYKPNNNYVGTDKVVFMVKMAGKEIKIIRYVKVTDRELTIRDVKNSYKNYCGKNSIWRIPSVVPEGALILNTGDEGVAIIGDYGLSADFADYSYLPPTITFRDLTGAAVGETVGEGADAVITLDTDAAGHGWYTGGMAGLSGLSLDADFSQGLDNTSSSNWIPAFARMTDMDGMTAVGADWIPASTGMTDVGARGLIDMSNWLPTSNPNEWVARAGTDAAGKMDMLSVLLHEYGHALGIEHSHDSHNYMGTTLIPGMRRLPTADDMQLMAQLAAEAREAIMAGNDFTLVTDAITQNQSQDGSRIEYGMTAKAIGRARLQPAATMKT